LFFVEAVASTQIFSASLASIPKILVNASSPGKISHHSLAGIRQRTYRMHGSPFHTITGP
jgi:hypothetical protein